jgi:hypothetical protein
MHPPKFLYSHTLSLWPDCYLEMHCHRCEQRSAVIQVKGLLRWYGNRTFAEILSRLRCQFCRRRPSAVSLISERGEDASTTQPARWTLPLVCDKDKAVWEHAP